MRSGLFRRVDPPGQSGAVGLQRTGLNLDAGQVVFGLGGNYGDCGQYRGRVVAVRETGGTPKYFTVDAAAGQRDGRNLDGGAARRSTPGRIWVGRRQRVGGTRPASGSTTATP